MSETVPQIELPLGRNRIAVRHSQVCHPVQRRTPHKQLSSLSLKAASTNTPAKDRLHSEDLRLCQRPPMIATLTFPLSSPLLSNRTQVLISDMSFSFRITVLPYLRSLLRRNRRPRLSFSNRVIAVAAVICSVGRDLRDFILHL